MPGKSKEDTWGAEELTNSIRDARSSGKSRHREKDKDRDRDKEKHRDKDKDREKHRDKDRDKEKHREKDRDKEKHRDKDKDRERRRDKDKERDKERDRDRHKEKDKERDRDKRDKDRDREKERERRGKDRERESSREKATDKERSKHRDRESSREKKSNGDGERPKEKSRSKDGDRERRRDKEKERDRDKDKREKSHRDRKDERSKDSSERRSESGKKDRHTDGEKERRREKEKDDGSRNRERHKDDDRDRRKEDKRSKDKEQKREKDRHQEKRSKDKEKDKERRREKEAADSDRKSGERKKRSEHENGRDDRLEKDKKKERRRQEEDNHVEDDVGEEIQKEEEPVQQDDAYNDYEDDFEDYDDDFEDEDDDDDEEEVDEKISSEVDELRRAMAAENQAMRKSADSQSSRSRSESSSASKARPTTSRTGRTFINFVAAKQRQISSQVSLKTKKRGHDLMNLIDLDVAGYDMFDMPPVREYDRYISSFGRSNTKQAFVQCNDDNLEREVQTEDVEGCEKWTQHPPEGAMISGGTRATDEEELELAVEKETNSIHFTHFMEKATQVIVVLLDEAMANRVGGKLESNKRSIVFSDGYTLMNTGTPILQGRCVTQVVFHPIQTNLILTLHSMPKKDGTRIPEADLKVMEKAGLTNRGLMCVWNINEPSRPQKILVLKSQPSTCTFSPSKATMAFCGTNDGSLCVWDLREAAGMHQKCEFGWGHVVVRVPTYSTEAGSPDESHQSQVVAMQPIVSAEDAKKATSKSSVKDDSMGMSFQLASVDERGTISFWVVIEIDRPDEAGSESDLGLVPNGRIKLIKSSSIQLSIPSRELGPIYQLKVTDMQLMPSNPNHFFITTDAGFVSHGARNTERVSPKHFWVNQGIPVGIKCIDFSPFNLPYFLVGCKDGSIQLFSTEIGTPLLSWPNATQGMDIVGLTWSRSRPAVFYIMDITSKVYVWELLTSDAGPVKTEQFTRGRLTALAVANDHAATGWGLAGRKPEMVISDDLGSLDIHQLTAKFCSADSNELDSLTALLEQLI